MEFKYIFSRKERPTNYVTLGKEEALYWLVRDFETCEYREDIRITSIVLNHEIWNNEDVIKAVNYSLDRKKAKIKCIAGPAISVDEQDHNTILNLGLEKKIELYPAKDGFFMPLQYRLFSDRFAWIQKAPLIEYELIGCGEYIINEDSLAKNGIRNLIAEFENKIEFLPLDKIVSEKQIFRLRNNVLNHIHKRLKVKGQNFHFDANNVETLTKLLQSWSKDEYG